jgi:hypothetical protein
MIIKITYDVKNWDNMEQKLGVGTKIGPSQKSSQLN